jgi:hypothetical protein
MGVLSLGRELQAKLPGLVVEAVHDRIDHILEETSGFVRLKVSHGSSNLTDRGTHRIAPKTCSSHALTLSRSISQLEDYLENIHDELRCSGLKDLPGLLRSIPMGFDHGLEFFFGCLFCDLDLKAWIEAACEDLTQHVERLMPNEPNEVSAARCGS